jgi:hypothetical protein
MAQYPADAEMQLRRRASDVPQRIAHFGMGLALPGGKCFIVRCRATLEVAFISFSHNRPLHCPSLPADDFTGLLRTAGALLISQVIRALN